MKYYCSLKKINFNSSAECLECKEYKINNTKIKVPENINFKYLVYLKMKSCEYFQPKIQNEEYHITKAIEHYINRNLKRDNYEEKKLYGFWNEIVGNYLSDKTKIISIKNGIVKIKAENKMLVNDLVYLKDIILEQIHKVLKNDKIKEILFY
ncbi:MAG TPA: DciA family protein [bacterium]|nr:DciA family protein [bacterium]HOL46849.1 DciA family protein [bacterium]HPQ18802.1 DciA family protein [bacterium]